MSHSASSTIIRQACNDSDIQACLAIRRQVFVIEQHVPLADELDGKDAESEHFLMLQDEVPIGVARVRFIEVDAKIERMAILSEYQHQGYGAALMRYLLEYLESRQVRGVQLSAQVAVIPFYEQLGFRVCSEEYLDAYIPHQDMYRDFNHCP